MFQIKLIKEVQGVQWTYRDTTHSQKLKWTKEFRQQKERSPRRVHWYKGEL